MTLKKNEIQQACSGITETPLVVGSVNGYRMFTMDHEGRLHAFSNEWYIWKPGENVAVCKVATVNRYVLGSTSFVLSHNPAGPQCTERVPNPACTCGFYAYHCKLGDSPGWGEAPKDSIHMMGIVECYGKVVIGSKGMRCEKARIRALFLRDTRSTKPYTPSRDLYGLCKSNYPDVEFFTGRKRISNALKQYPLYTPNDIDRTSPEFWKS